MKLEEFIERFNGSPVDHETFAERIIQHLEDEKAEDLYWAARDFLDALEDFADEMQAAGLELG